MKRSVKKNLYSRKISRKNKTRKMKYKDKKTKKMRYKKTKGKKNRYIKKYLHGGSEKISIAEAKKRRNEARKRRAEARKKSEAKSKALHQKATFVEKDTSAPVVAEPDSAEISMEPGDRTSSIDEQQRIQRRKKFLSILYEDKERELREARGSFLEESNKPRAQPVFKGYSSTVQLALQLKTIIENKEELITGILESLYSTTYEGFIEKSKFEEYMKKRGFTEILDSELGKLILKYSIYHDDINDYISFIDYIQMLQDVYNHFELIDLEYIKDFSNMNRKQQGIYFDKGEEILAPFTAESRDRRRRKRHARKTGLTERDTDTVFTDGRCWEAHIPEYSDLCDGYSDIGYTCVGNWCAAMDPTGNPSECARLADPGTSVDPNTGRCVTPPPSRAEEPVPAPAEEPAPDEEEDDDEDENEDVLTRTMSVALDAATAVAPDAAPDEEDMDEFVRNFDPVKVREALGEKVDPNKLWSSMLSRDDRDDSNEKSEPKVTFGDDDERTMTPTSSIDSDVTIDF